MAVTSHRSLPSRLIVAGGLGTMFCAACTSPAAVPGGRRTTPNGSRRQQLDGPFVGADEPRDAVIGAADDGVADRHRRSAQGSVTVGRTVATGIRVPWGLARLPDGAVLVSARDSYQIFVANLGAGRGPCSAPSPARVRRGQAGEGGLLGIAVSPNFTGDRWSTCTSHTASDNRIARSPTTPAARRKLGHPMLVSGIKHNCYHNGGRLKFGPDGYLYATTGEAQTPDLAQDRTRSTARSCG